MKKITLITAILFMSLQANASVVVDTLGPTTTYPAGVERNFIINTNEDGEFDIAVRPLDDALVRNDGKVRIPLQYLFINNTHEDVYIRYNEFSTIFHRVSMGGFAQSMIAKVRDYGIVPAGVYNLNFEVQAIDPDNRIVKSTSNFNLQFVVPVEQKIGFPGQRPRINVESKDVFTKNKLIPSENSPQVLVTSNADWVLLLKNPYSGEQPGYYYVRTVGASANVQERLQDRVRIEEGKEIVIAKGKAPANNEYVSVEYSVVGKDGETLKPGDYTNNLRYVLREDRGQ